MKKKPFYITTTLPYVNAEPHIGHALEFIRADIIARSKKSAGFDVFFNTGTDEHGIKVYKKAQQLGIDPQTYVDQASAKFKEILPALGMSEDINFIRTTDPHHVKAAQEFWRIVNKNGYIYKKNYSVKYCIGCELEKTESEIAKLNTSNTALQEQIKDLASVTTELRNFASTANERAYKRAKSEIEASMRQAVSEADVPKFEQARAELDQLNQDAIDAGARKVEPKTEPKVEPKVEPKTEVATPQQQQQLAPEVVTFIDANPWFLSDGTLNTYMQDRHLTLQREEPGLTLTQNLAKAKKQVQDKFPERFGINPNREAAPAVSTTTTTRVAKTKKLGYDDLPADAKAMCDKFVKTIPPKRDRETGKMVPYSREEYLQTYFGDQEV